MSTPGWTRAALAAAGALALGCAQARPRFGDDVQTALAGEDMRLLETRDMRIYYPARDRDVALRAAARLEGCREALAAHAPIESRASREKLVMVLPRVPLNNAYVQPATLGSEHVSVVPTFFTTDLFAVLGLPPDPSMIGCHEMVHYVHHRQLSGIPNGLETLFGYLYSPQTGLEPWFGEGIATYYETRLQRPVGRLASAYWSGHFAAGVAEDGLHESDTDSFTRRIPYGGQYLVGSHFIDWLVQKYGERRLWDVIGRQSDEVAFPLGVSGRFRNAFGRSLAPLYGEFARETERRFRARARPPGQRLVRSLDLYARYAVAPDGTEAIVEQGLDTQARLRVFSPEGALVVDRNLTDLVPPRALLTPIAQGTSGLSFTADSKHLYWVALDTGRIFQTSRLVRVDVSTGELSIVRGDLGGAGGSISPDGARYYYARARGDRWELAAYDIASGTSIGIADYGPRAYVVSPRVSPDGSKVALSIVSGEGADVLVVDARTGHALTRVPGPSAARVDPSWVDDETLLYVAETEGRLQVFRASLARGAAERVTDAPHLAFAPFAHRGHVRILNREGWRWTVDDVELSPPPGSSAVAPSHAEDEAVPPRDAPLAIEADAPYRNTDGLFVPTLRGPSVIVTGSSAFALGAGVTGGDRLGFHRWGLEAAWDFVAREPSGRIQYINTQLAPVFVTLLGQHVGSRERIVFDTPAGETDRRIIRKETVGVVNVARRFWTSIVSTGFRYDEVRDGVVLLPTGEVVPRDRQAAGPQLTLTYDATETTPAAGPRRALVVSTSGSYFPGLSDVPFGDARAAVAVVRPLPLSRRHTLSLFARGRALPGRPDASPLLQVGGLGAFSALGVEVSGEEASYGALPPTLRFQEVLRGFEDLALLTNRALLGEAVYRYPLVLDTGSITTMTVLPSFLLRQIDFEGFGSGATLLDGRFAAAAGGAIIARLKLWVVPFNLGLQVSRRFTQDDAVTFALAGGG